MKKILILDEEKISVMGIRFSLEENFNGIEIFTARTCSEGMEYLEKQKFDLIILDMMVPRGSMQFSKDRIDFRYGIDFLVDLRKKNLKLPVICYTIINNDDELESQIKINDAIYICKLFENANNDLIRAVNSKLFI